jgi:alpha-glucoside transport system permease protein
VNQGEWCRPVGLREGRAEQGGGNFGTHILPSYMMSFMFRDDGRATAVAFVIMIIVTPVMIWNIVQARKEMR